MKVLRDERGAVLVLSLLMIALLSVIGIWSTQTSTSETRISRNDKLHKTAFYEAEGGTEVGIELLERNIEERGFNVDGSGNCYIGMVAVDTDSSLTFYMNTDLGTTKPDCTNANRDVFMPRTQGPCTPPITNLKIGGNTALSTGGALQMIAGYEGKGKGAAGGGAWVTYDVRSQNRNVDNSESIVNIRWRHVM